MDDKRSERSPDERSDIRGDIRVVADVATLIRATLARRMSASGELAAKQAAVIGTIIHQAQLLVLCE
jgi:hypothetical protein